MNYSGYRMNERGCTAASLTSGRASISIDHVSFFFAGVGEGIEFCSGL